MYMIRKSMTEWHLRIFLMTGNVRDVSREKRNSMKHNKHEPMPKAPKCHFWVKKENRRE